MTDNLKFWDSVKTTPTKYVKDGKIGQLAIKSVNPQYQRKVATEKFGMFGIGWGVKPESVKYTEVVLDESTTILKYEAILFYIEDGVEGVIPIATAIPLIYLTKGGYKKIDPDAYKKAATGALTKGLSFLGFSADIFMGLYDDWDYVQSIQQEEAAKKEELAIDQKHEYKKWRMIVQGDLLKCKTLEDLEKCFVAAIRKANDNKDNEIINTLNDVKNKRKKELTQSGEK